MCKEKIISLILAIFIVIVLTSYSPYVPSYGGKIWFINKSSYNLLLEFFGGYPIYNNIESKIYIEKQEQLSINHVFLSSELADPNVCFKQLRIYDTDTGNLLKELQIADTLFIQDSGSINFCNAEFSFNINNSLF